MNRQWIRRTLLLVVALMLCGSLTRQAGAQQGVDLRPEQRDYLAGLRAAAIHGDRTCIPELIKALHDDRGVYQIVALHGLKHLHVVEALPDIETYIQKCGGEDKALDGVAARAVLLAPLVAVPTPARQAKQVTLDGVPNAVRLQEAQTQVAHLMQTLHFDSDRLKSDLAAYHHAQLTHEIDWTPVLYVLNNMADLAYYGDYAACMALPEFKIFAQADIMGASLKMKYAAIPRALRYKRLVDDMAMTGEEGGTLQLAIDEGLPASRYAATKLMEMDKNRARYSVTKGGNTYVHPGFSSLFRLIAGVGDKAQLPVIEHFLHDRDGWIGYYANQVHAQVRLGLRTSWAIDF